jgi:hypothetical protein
MGSLSRIIRFFLKIRCLLLTIPGKGLISVRQGPLSTLPGRVFVCVFTCAGSQKNSFGNVWTGFFSKSIFGQMLSALVIFQQFVIRPHVHYHGHLIKNSLRCDLHVCGETEFQLHSSGLLDVMVAHTKRF